jgi:hypothetical protein
MTPDTPTQRFLAGLDACQDACAWVAGRDLATAWAACKRGDWMLWLVGRTIAGGPWSDERRPLVGAAVRCARLALPIYEARYPGDRRVSDCLDAFGRWAAGEDVPREVLIAARRAVDDAAAAAAAAAAASAAVDDATSASSAAADAADDAADDAAYAYAYAYAYAAADAADDAAYAAAYAYAYAAADAERQRALARCADICREAWPMCPVSLPEAP